MIRTIAAALVGFYLFVAWAMFHPRVSETYRAYYIDHTTELCEYQRSLLEYVEPGATYTHASTASLGFDGWSHTEEAHRWTLGHRPAIVFKVQDPGQWPATPILHLRIFPLERQQATISLNGRVLRSLVVDADMDLTLETSRDDYRPGENTLLFDLPDARRPGPQDDRILALGLRSLSFTPPQPAK